MFGMHTQHGYANFGFKEIAPNIGHKNRGKYGDRDLYSTVKKSKLSHISDFSLIQSFSVQKAGNVIAECEDVWHQSDRGKMSIALSDGATESSFAKEWAKQLVTAFVDRVRSRDEIDHYKAKNWLYPLQINWQQWLANQDLSWFAKRKAAEGAFATFLSLEISNDLSWKSLAVGDSCLFVVRNSVLLKSFPLQNSYEFNNRPRLIGTHTQSTNINIFHNQGDAQIGDRFFLTTDAIAFWIFKQIEANQNPWIQLDCISSQQLFVEWVTERRNRHEMANDDTTLLCVEIKDTDKNCCAS